MVSRATKGKVPNLAIEQRGEVRPSSIHKRRSLRQNIWCAKEDGEACLHRSGLEGLDEVG
jgi:hypothetical protein